MLKEKPILFIFLVLTILTINFTTAFNLGVQYQPNAICAPNSIACQDSSTLKTCNNNGTNFVLEKCSGGCVINESGIGHCIQKGPQPNYFPWILSAILAVALVTIVIKRKK